MLALTTLATPTAASAYCTVIFNGAPFEDANCNGIPDIGEDGSPWPPPGFCGYESSGVWYWFSQCPFEPLAPSSRLCFDVAGSPGDVAVVNLTPVEARAGGNGQLVSSDVASPPVASNVNFGPGSVDPNVAITKIGPDGKVCYVNSSHTSVHLVADHLGTIASSAFVPATPSGAPDRRIDTRVGERGPCPAGSHVRPRSWVDLDGDGQMAFNEVSCVFDTRPDPILVAPSQRLCFSVVGAPGDAAVVNLTPVEAGGAGNGQLVSSDLMSPTVGSNVNFGPGSVDPNVALARIGADGKVCYVNSSHTNVHLVADHLGTIAAGVLVPPTPSGAPGRRIDTRDDCRIVVDLGGTEVLVCGEPVSPSGRLCFSVAGAPGDAAIVNLTPVLAAGAGNGQLVSSDVASPPVASNVNFGVGSVDPNVAVAQIGADGRVCYVNSSHTAVHMIADHLGTIAQAAYTPATPSGAPDRKVDTRREVR